MEVMVQVLCMAYRLIIVTICAKYFQNPLNYEEVIDGTQNLPYFRLLIFEFGGVTKCDLGGRDPCFVPDI
jgi:hypothetical protein